MTFLGGEIGSGFGEPGGTPPPRIPRSTQAKHKMVPVFLELFLDSLQDGPLGWSYGVRLNFASH